MHSSARDPLASRTGKGAADDSVVGGSWCGRSGGGGGVLWTSKAVKKGKIVGSRRHAVPGDSGEGRDALGMSRGGGGGGIGVDGSSDMGVGRVDREEMYRKLQVTIRLILSMKTRGNSNHFTQLLCRRWCRMWRL